MRRTPLLFIALIVTGAVATLQAQEDPNLNPNDSAEHGVARVSVINGDVSVQRGDSGEQSAAAVNAPLVAGDIIGTAPGARVEIQFDAANMLRLAPDSEVKIGELTAKRYQVQVGRGTVILSVVRDSRAQVEINTPSVSVRPVQRGAYRITVFEDGHSEITPRAGEAEVYGPRGVETLRVGNTMMVRGDPSDPEFNVAGPAVQDDFDRWNAERDQNLMRSTSYQHVNPEIQGADDLDSHGQWVSDPQYGDVWHPAVGPDWAPYRYGRWVWEDWYGWTWVSYDPWGWAPFHYGRWFYGAGGWCWAPGPIYARPFWSPALVAFFGFGGFHVGIGFGGPGFGWVPLAPFEAFHPWWGRGFYGGFRNQNVLVNNVNVVNNVNIVNTYRNARVANGVTAVNANDFARGRMTTPMRVSSAQLQQASLVRGQVPITPSSSSLRFSDRPVTSPVRATAFNNSRSNSPASANRVPFAQQQQSLSQVNRQQGSVAIGNSSRAPSMVPTVRSNAPSAPAAHAAAAGTSPGWRRFGNSPQAPESAGSGWSRFGNPATPRANSATASGWRTVGDRPSTASPSMPQRYQSAPSDGWRRFQPSTQSSPRYSSPGYSGSSRSLQIAPPIVRERSAPSYQPSSGGGRSSAPAHQSAPPSGSHSTTGNGGGSGHSSSGSSGHSSGSSGGHSSHK